MGNRITFIRNNGIYRERCFYKINFPSPHPSRDGLRERLLSLALGGGREREAGHESRDVERCGVRVSCGSCRSVARLQTRQGWPPGSGADRWISHWEHPKNRRRCYVLTNREAARSIVLWHGTQRRSQSERSRLYSPLLFAHSYRLVPLVLPHCSQC